MDSPRPFSSDSSVALATGAPTVSAAGARCHRRLPLPVAVRSLLSKPSIDFATSSVLSGSSAWYPGFSSVMAAAGNRSRAPSRSGRPGSGASGSWSRQDFRYQVGGKPDVIHRSYPLRPCPPEPLRLARDAFAQEPDTRVDHFQDGPLRVRRQGHGHTPPGQLLGEPAQVLGVGGAHAGRFRLGLPDRLRQVPGAVLIEQHRPAPGAPDCVADNAENVPDVPVREPLASLASSSSAVVSTVPLPAPRPQPPSLPLPCEMPSRSRTNVVKQSIGHGGSYDSDK